MKGLLVVVLAAFLVLSGLALNAHGYWGIIEPHFRTFGAAQVFTDLVIALTLVMTWMVRDARASGRNPWGWVAFTLVTGSIGPLVYLILRKPSASAAQSR